MAVMKRIGGYLGQSAHGGSKLANNAASICPHCHRQTRYVPVRDTNVCQLCGKDPDQA